MSATNFLWLPAPYAIILSPHIKPQLNPRESGTVRRAAYEAAQICFMLWQAQCDQGNWPDEQCGTSCYQ